MSARTIRNPRELGRVILAERCGCRLSRLWQYRFHLLESVRQSEHKNPLLNGGSGLKNPQGRRFSTHSENCCRRKGRLSTALPLNILIRRLTAVAINLSLLITLVSSDNNRHHKHEAEGASRDDSIEPLNTAGGIPKPVTDKQHRQQRDHASASYEIMSEQQPAL